MYYNKEIQNNHKRQPVAVIAQGKKNGSVSITDKRGSEPKMDSLGSATIQRIRVGIKEKEIKKLGKGNKKTVEKLKILVSVMRNALKSTLSQDNLISIEIINNGEMSPAWNHHKGSTTHPGKEGDIGVELNKWYLEKASIGELLGMFIHEIGVHTLADRKMGAKVHGTLLPTGTASNDEYYDQDKDHKNRLGKIIGKYPSNLTTKTEERSRQRDHVNLAKSLEGGKSTRKDHYINLYLATGDALYKSTKLDKKDTALKELTQSFLFDLARLAATDDGGAYKVIKNTRDIGELMTYYQKNILQPHEKSHQWLKEASAKIITGEWKIRIWLAKQLGTLLISSHPHVQTGRAVTSGLATALYVGGGITGALSFPALAIGTAVGLGVYGLQKLFGI